MSNEDFKTKLIVVLKSLKNGSTTNNMQKNVKNVKNSPIPTSTKTKIMREVQQSGEYIREIPKLARLMLGGRRKHTVRKTRRALRKRKTYRK